ncbi:MAG: hypothetical protein LBD88_04500 [Candidatus Peribacteria bacterium]|nr:hypothetical protein [Candidatus Peribacteria bacterium]
MYGGSLIKVSTFSHKIKFLSKIFHLIIFISLLLSSFILAIIFSSISKTIGINISVFHNSIDNKSSSQKIQIVILSIYGNLS